MKTIILSLLLQYMQIQHERLGFSGILLVAKHDKVLYQQTIGMASVELNVPISIDNKFRIASVTKSFTAWLIVQAAKEGKLRLTDSLSSYIPNRWPKITIEELLTHTSGIPHNEGITDYWTIKSRLPLTKEQALAEILQMKLLEKGTHYSSPGYFLLACILEKVYKNSYENILRSKLPLKSTGVYNMQTIFPSMTTGYHMMGDSLITAPYRDASLMKGSGDVYTTAKDLLLWNNTCNDYTYGWTKEGDAYYHGGGSFGCSAINVVYPKDSISIILLSNVSAMPVNEMWHDIEKIIFNRPFEMPQINTPIKIADPAKFAGRYETLQIINVNEKLYAKLGSNPAFEIFASGPLEFFGKKVNIRLIFEQDSTGRITGLKAEGNGRTLQFNKSEK
ncbi:serine hydrolase [Chitinophaga sp. SYP-B3965]|uniref:serine hydrolase domain-containing protein n=1 Tax=Chitinophaga sp. SYP-B3965 TaxID=2663120 RepID=UPI00129994DE|nr:serine hydrolase domain-containing protein [Chitinophaga sp. SYP-B3965]MRG43841.1 serine hydrolase [Chitinophaga sp. SYP-B3965]